MSNEDDDLDKSINEIKLIIKSIEKIDKKITEIDNDTIASMRDKISEKLIERLNNLQSLGVTNKTFYKEWKEDQILLGGEYPVYADGSQKKIISSSVGHLTGFLEDQLADIQVSRENDSGENSASFYMDVSVFFERYPETFNAFVEKQIGEPFFYLDPEDFVDIIHEISLEVSDKLENILDEVPF